VISKNVTNSVYNSI